MASISFEAMKSLKIAANCDFARGKQNLHAQLTEEGSCHATTIKLSPRQKLDVTNHIHALHRLHPLSLSSNTSCVQQMSAS